jgi:hypothetical protein
MIVDWEPYWYELDQTIVVGDIDYFYLDEKDAIFSNGFVSSEDKEVRAEIIKITHTTLGMVRGILTIGLDYKVFLNNGRVIEVNAEESPGDVYNENIIINDWLFKVDIKILEVTGLSSQQRLAITDNHERKRIFERQAKYKHLLGIDDIKGGWGR